jgi:AcrR family transcriptional regulator
MGSPRPISTRPTDNFGSEMPDPHRKSHRDDDRHTRREARRAELLDAAIEAIRAIGPGVTMEQLAASGGVTKPILYRHFGDRDGLITAVADVFAQEVLNEVQTSLVTDADPRQLLVSTVNAYLSFIEREPSLYRFLMQRGAAQPINGLIDQISRQVASVIGERLRGFGLDSGPAEPWAYGIVGMVHQAGDWWLDHQTMPRARLVEYLASLLWDGLSGQTASTIGLSPQEVSP